ncbi:hypothetical protein F4778DRAFT_798549 [Xylariomycetidae sp. FL2044]|nr:hypothetical protein F4778DRAFT_798549 [Xylariomycetidae sp. FL2044]
MPGTYPESSSDDGRDRKPTPQSKKPIRQSNFLRLVPDNTSSGAGTSNQSAQQVEDLRKELKIEQDRAARLAADKAKLEKQLSDLRLQEPSAPTVTVRDMNQQFQALKTSIADFVSQRLAGVQTPLVTRPERKEIFKLVTPHWDVFLDETLRFGDRKLFLTACIWSKIHHDFLENPCGITVAVSRRQRQESERSETFTSRVMTVSRSGPSSSSRAPSPRTISDSRRHQSAQDLAGFYSAYSGNTKYELRDAFRPVVDKAADLAQAMTRSEIPCMVLTTVQEGSDKRFGIKMDEEWMTHVSRGLKGQQVDFIISPAFIEYVPTRNGGEYRRKVQTKASVINSLY